MVRRTPEVIIVDKKFEPKFPAVDLDTLEILDAPKDGTQFPLPQPQELDELLYSEAMQRNYLHGLLLPEYAMLNDMEPLGPDEVQAPEPTISVDESTWIKTLRRDHWVRHNMQVEGYGFYWDASDDIIWDALKLPLEMANRMLLAACNTRWFVS